MRIQLECKHRTVGCADGEHIGFSDKGQRKPFFTIILKALISGSKCRASLARCMQEKGNRSLIRGRFWTNPRGSASCEFPSPSRSTTAARGQVAGEANLPSGCTHPSTEWAPKTPKGSWIGVAPGLSIRQLLFSATVISAGE